MLAEEDMDLRGCKAETELLMADCGSVINSPWCCCLYNTLYQSITTCPSPAALLIQSCFCGISVHNTSLREMHPCGCKSEGRIQ